MSVDIKECLRLWRRKYGEEKVGKSYGQTYFSIPIKDRRHLLIIFLRWMKMKGLEKENFKNKSSFLKDLIDICFGSAPAFNKEKREQGHRALKEELEDVIDTEVFCKKKSRVQKNAKPFVPELVKAPEPINEPRMYGREVDESLYADLPKPEIVYDEEFAKLIGVDPNE